MRYVTIYEEYYNTPYCIIRLQYNAIEHTTVNTLPLNMVLQYNMIQYDITVQNSGIIRYNNTDSITVE